MLKLIRVPIASEGGREYRFMQPSSVMVAVKPERDPRGSSLG